MAAGMAAVRRRALVLLATGSEEMETVITVDVLRRGGVEVTLAGLTGDGAVECSRGVRIVPDVALANVDMEANDFDVVVLPGGLKGAQAFAQSEHVHAILKRQHGRGKDVAAICAAPIALHAAGIALGAHLTSHPSVQDQLSSTYTYLPERVVQDGLLVTSRGPGTTFDFALTLVERLQGKAKRDEITAPMML